jgi:hypothetical protein
MKLWITKKWIALAEVFGWRTPTWVRGLVPAETFEKLTSRERDLTDLLSNGSPREHPVPAFLKEKIERGIHDSSPESKRKSPWSSLLIPASAFAMAVVVGFIVLFPGTSPIPDAVPEVELAVVTEVPESTASPALVLIGEGLAGLEKGLIMQPLELEKQRLAADVTNALQFMSRSILPDAFADDVNTRLDNLREEVSQSI